MIFMEKEFICICCPMGCRLKATETDGNLNVSGNGCPRGKAYAADEFKAPKRTVTSTVEVSGSKKMLSVKTLQPIPKQSVFEALRELKSVKASPPVKIGDVVLENAAGSGVPFVATKDVY